MTFQRGSWRSNISEKESSPSLPTTSVNKVLSSIEEREKIKDADKIIEQRLKEMNISTSWLEDDNDDDFLLDSIIVNPTAIKPEIIEPVIVAKTFKSISKPIEKPIQSLLKDNSPLPEQNLENSTLSTTRTSERITVRLYKDSKPIQVEIKFNNK